MSDKNHLLGRNVKKEFHYLATINPQLRKITIFPLFSLHLTNELSLYSLCGANSTGIIKDYSGQMLYCLVQNFGVRKLWQFSKLNTIRQYFTLPNSRFIKVAMLSIVNSPISPPPKL